MDNRIRSPFLTELQGWFEDRGYWGAEIKHDPSLSNPRRYTLYIHKETTTWKIYDDSAVPIYLGSAYMTTQNVAEIMTVTRKVSDLYGDT